MKPFTRLHRLLLRRRRAREFGVIYSRDRSWETPGQIQFAGRMEPLLLPADHGTRIAFKDIFLEDVYGLRELRSAPRTILDVGAHAGLFSLYARILFPSALIHAYEPNPLMQSFLEHQATLGKFTTYSEGVGVCSERGTLSFGPDSVFTKASPDAQGDLRITGIGDAIKRLGGSIDLLKLDCEGCEWGVLEDRDAMQRVGRLTMEYHLFEGRPLAMLQERLESTGWHIDLSQADGETNGRIWAHRSL